jgi:hypothetical protein
MYVYIYIDVQQETINSNSTLTINSVASRAVEEECIDDRELICNLIEWNRSTHLPYTYNGASVYRLPPWYKEEDDDMQYILHACSDGTVFV